MDEMDFPRGCSLGEGRRFALVGCDSCFPGAHSDEFGQLGLEGFHSFAALG
jgi:hypothetical protein